jgi:hypothetical protein
MPHFPYFTYKGGRNAKAGKIAVVCSLSRNKTPYVESLLIEANEMGHPPLCN